MLVYNFEKKGIQFSFRNPEWNDVYNELNMEWKIKDIKENSKNDGYYYNSTFLPDKKAMRLYNVTIDGKQIGGVVLPDDILKEIEAIYEELKENALQRKLNKDIKYALNDTNTYGIYNGISQFDIGIIVWDIKKQLNSNVLLFAEEIAKILNKDEELKRIAMETYQPYPESKNWSDEYLSWYREAVKEKKAPGYGIIPNKIIREKITEIIVTETEKENKKKQEEEIRINNLFKLAKQTGKKQLIKDWIEPCCDKNEECDLDICSLWAMPDGTKKLTRTHTH